MPIVLLQIVLNGIFLGLLYATYAAGFSIVYGVMKIANLAYGDFVVIAATIAFLLFNYQNIDPFISIFVTLPLFVVFGAGLYFLVQRLLTSTKIEASWAHWVVVIVFFGISIMIENVLLITIAPLGGEEGYVGISASKLAYGATFSFAGYYVNEYNLLIGIFAISSIAVLSIVISRTYFGKALRAVSERPHIVSLVGINVQWIYALGFIISMVFAGLAGVLYSLVLPIGPTSGFDITVICFAITLMAGAGSISGTFWAGLLFGVATNLGFFFFGTLGGSVPFALFIAALVLRAKSLGTIV